MIQSIDLTQSNFIDNIKFVEKSNKKLLYEIGRINQNRIFYSPILNKIYKIGKNDFVDLKRKIETDVAKKIPTTTSSKKKDTKKIIIIFLTTACNLRCVYCYGYGGDKASFINFNFIKAQIDDIANSGIKELTILFHGTGEPTLAFGLIKKTVKYAKSKLSDVNFNIQSNAVVNKKVLNWLINNKFNFIISCDGPPYIQNKQRPSLNKNYSSIIERTIKKLIEKNCLSVIRGTLTDYSAKKMIEILEYFHNLGVGRVKLEPVLLLGRAIKDKSIYSKPVKYDEVEENLLKVNELADEYGIKLNSNFIPIFGVRNTPCSFPQLILATDGHIRSCANYTLEKDKQQEFMKYGKYDPKLNKIIVNRKKLKELKKINVENMPYCSDCFLKWNCAGWCYLMNFYETGSPLTPNKLICNTIRRITKKHLIYKVKKRFIQIKPYIYKKNKQLFFSMYFNQFKLNPTSGLRLKGYPFIKIDLKKINLKDLAKKIIAHKKSRTYKPTLFLLSFQFKENELNIKIGREIICFLDKLKKNKIFFKLTKSLPFCILPKNVNIRNYNSPKNCRDCLELFTVKNNKFFNFCVKSKSENIEKYSNRDRIFEEFKRKYNPKFLKKCLYCVNAIRGNCQRVCLQ